MNSENINGFFFRMAIRYHRHIRLVLLLGGIVHCVKRRIVVSDAFDRLVSKVSKRIQGGNYRQGFQCDKQCVNMTIFIKGTSQRQAIIVNDSIVIGIATSRAIKEIAT